MRPVIYGLLVVGILFMVALVITWFRIHDPARPDVAIGLAALLFATLLNPILWVASVAGFALTYWQTR